MGESGFSTVDGANALLDELLLRADSLMNSEFWKLTSEQLLDLGRRMETLSRVVWVAQVKLIDELDQTGAAAARSISSTSVLARQAFGISAGEAGARVAAARATLPQDLPSGGERPAVRPVLAAAMAAGAVDPENVQTVIKALRRLPDTLPAEVMVEAEQVLVDHATTVDPARFRVIAEHVLDAIDPDGSDDLIEAARSKVEFTLGKRSTATGLTSINGRLDDLGVATITAVINALSAPKAEVDGVKDPRPTATRQAHALIEALEFTLHHGADVLPAAGGVRPQVTVILDWDAMKNRAAQATLDTGMPMGAGDLRRTLCDAYLIPVVLGGPSKVLDVGRSQRLFTSGMRKALTARDRGCAFPGCSRPSSFCEAHHILWWERDLGPTNSRMVSCYAGTTTPKYIGRTGGSLSPTTEPPNSSRHPGWTRPAPRDATPSTTYRHSRPFSMTSRGDPDSRATQSVSPPSISEQCPRCHL